MTGFGLLGHLHEMLGERCSAVQAWERIPVLPGALNYAGEFLLAAAAQRNRNFVGERVKFDHLPFAAEEVLFDPQTSGGLLCALPEWEADRAVEELRQAGLPAAVIGVVTAKSEFEITVR